jgi:hypothetical protein
MNRNFDFRSGLGRHWLVILGWILSIVFGMVLVWFGFLRPSDGDKSQAPDLTATAVVALAESLTRPTATLSPFTPTVPPVAATAAPAPTLAPLVEASPTQAPQPTPTAPPSITAGDQGVNVRTGPGTHYSLLGALDPGAQAPVTGRYGNWWQISYNNAAGWVLGDIVTVANAEGVPEVQPPPAPTLPPATAVPTAAPATATPTPPPAADTRGLVVDGYQVEGAPGPYPLGADIWFNMWITNKSGASVGFNALGTWIQENNQFQMSWTNSAIQPGPQFIHRDHLYAHHITAAGAYHLYLRICFTDGVCVNLAGPVEIVVQ